MFVVCFKLQDFLDLIERFFFRQNCEFLCIMVALHIKDVSF